MTRLRIGAPGGFSITLSVGRGLVVFVVDVLGVLLSCVVMSEDERSHPEM